MQPRLGVSPVLASTGSLARTKGIELRRVGRTDPYAYVISANIRRRHLTAEQKRELIAKLIKATPEKAHGGGQGKPNSSARAARLYQFVATALLASIAPRRRANDATR